MLLTSCTRSRVYYVRNYRGRARERASCFTRRENEAGTGGGQRRERIEPSRLRTTLIAPNLYTRRIPWDLFSYCRDLKITREMTNTQRRFIKSALI
jgi:hypothetical protein